MSAGWTKKDLEGNLVEDEWCLPGGILSILSTSVGFLAVGVALFLIDVAAGAVQCWFCAGVSNLPRRSVDN